MKTPRAATTLAILLALASSPRTVFAQEPPGRLDIPKIEDFPTFGGKAKTIAAPVEPAKAFPSFGGKTKATSASAEPAKDASGLPTFEDLRKRSEITALIRDKEYASAIELLHGLIGQFDAQGFWARQTLVLCAIQAGDLTAALREAELALQYAPDEAAAHFSRGGVQLARKRPDLALEDFHRAVRLGPQDVGGYFMRGVTYAARGDARLALADFREAERLGLRGAHLPMQQGVALASLGEGREAIAMFTEALKLDPNMVDARHWRATCYLASRRMDEAIDDLTAFLVLKPDQPEALFKRAYAYHERGEFANALLDLDRFQVIQQDDNETPHLRRLIIAKMGDARRLAAALATARANEFDATWMMMARCYAAGADDERAQLAACDDVLHDYPDSSLARILRAKINEDGEEFEAARADLDLLLKKEPDLRTGLLMRNKILNLIGDHAQAAADAERLIRLEPDSPGGYVGLADALTGKDDHAGAIAPISRAIELARGRRFVVGLALREEVEGNTKRAATHEESTRFVEAGEPRSATGGFFAVFPILSRVTGSGETMPPPSRLPGAEVISIFCDADELYSRRADSYLELGRPKEALADVEVVLKAIDRTGAKASAAFLLRARALRELDKPREAITDAETARSLAKSEDDRADAEAVLLQLSSENILLIPLPRTLGGIPMFGE